MMTAPITTHSADPGAARTDQRLRQRLMRALAQAEPAQIAEAMAGLGDLPAALDLRQPQTGLVMLRGRIGGDGAAFNIGEATVSRAAVKIASGEVGFGWRLGRSLVAARQAAIADALLQRPEWQARILETVILPLEAQRDLRRNEAAQETAATRVEFFTMARGSE
jgi:alpha-D-ribose 1-methylphosphonate 5-triphosphate synthase subunit PhnG